MSTIHFTIHQGETSSDVDYAAGNRKCLPKCNAISSALM